MKIPTMDDGPNSAPHNGQLGPSSSVQSSSTVKTNNNEDNNARNQYSIPGILHFIQHEWARFEMERSQWEVERAELQVRIIIRKSSFSSPDFLLETSKMMVITCWWGAQLIMKRVMMMDSVFVVLVGRVRRMFFRSKIHLPGLNHPWKSVILRVVIVIIWHEFFTS